MRTGVPPLAEPVLFAALSRRPSVAARLFSCCARCSAAIRSCSFCRAFSAARRSCSAFSCCKRCSAAIRSCSSRSKRAFSAASRSACSCCCRSCSAFSCAMRSCSNCSHILIVPLPVVSFRLMTVRDAVPVLTTLFCATARAAQDKSNMVKRLFTRFISSTFWQTAKQVSRISHFPPAASSAPIPSRPPRWHCGNSCMLRDNPRL